VIQKLRRQKTANILFLCYGNICRSPLAAAIAKRRFPQVSFQSAGFHPSTGRQSPDFVLATARKLGLDLVEHRSKQVNAKRIDEADLIAIMDVRNRNSLKKEFPYALKKTLFLGMMLPRPQLEISDSIDHPESMEENAARIDTAVERMSNLCSLKIQAN
jgi:protein-tyrosine-phosphatase